MGASAREIERQIKETRERMDVNLTRLESRATAGAKRYGVVAAAVAGVALIAGIGLLVYRRTHRPTLRDRLDDLSVDDLRGLVRRLREQLPSVTVRVNERSDAEPGTMESILRKVTPALVGTAGSALLERLATPRQEEYVPPQAE